MKLNFTLKQVEALLQKQKEITFERLANQTYIYNKESTAGQALMLPIDREKMKEVAMAASFPEDFKTLKKYIDETP